MKYFSELSEIETQIIRLDCVQSLFRVVAQGAEQASHEDITNSLWHLEGSLDDISKKLRQSFDVMWEKDREDNFDNLAKKEKNK